MGKLRNTLIVVAMGAAMAAQASPAQSSTPGSLATGSTGSTASTTPLPATGSTGPTVDPTDPVVGPPIPDQPTPSAGSGGIGTGPADNGTRKQPTTKPTPAPEQDNPGSNQSGGITSAAADAPSINLDLTAGPNIACEGAPGAPTDLLPIYKAASDRYGLGPKGPGILASINLIETDFGRNTNYSSAGAMGWMQFMPSTWASYAVDGDADGKADPYNPWDAIFAAASYLKASNAPADWYGAIYSYNHADWYVAEVLAKAGCYNAGSQFSLVPEMPTIACKPAPAWRDEIPGNYLNAFEEASARYGLGKKGVWSLASMARLESDFGRGMSKADMKEVGPLGLDTAEWQRYAVDGNGDGKIVRSSPEDSAATLARLIWSTGSLRAGIFEHNHAAWYVQVVLSESDRLEGKCKVTTSAWPIALPSSTASPINWDNLTLSNDLEQQDLDNGVIDPRIVGLIGAITQTHTITISALKSDHSYLTASGNVSNHSAGRAMDIAMVDGVSCTDVSPSAPCGTLGRTLTLLPPGTMPTELIYCYDLDGPSGPAFALPDHCDHVHVGFDR